jgi:hypothetical protein
MSIIDMLMRSQWGTEVKAGLAFLAVTAFGTVLLLVLAAVFGAATLTPMGVWAGLMVIGVAGIAAAATRWRDARSGRHRRAQGPFDNRHPEVRPSRVEPPVERASRPSLEVKLVRPPPLPQPPPALAPKEAAADDSHALKRAFDQALTAGRLDEAQACLDRLEASANEAAWVGNKRRLLQQERRRR